MSSPDPVRAIADAVLYEGYVLWPYRRSALKNTHRWTFGGVYPRAHAQARGDAGDDPWTMQTQCLIEGGDHVRVSIGLRFLHVIWRQVVDASGHALDELTVGGASHLTWEEAVEREVGLAEVTLAELATTRRVPVSVAAGQEEEPLGPEGGVVRSWEALDGTLAVCAEQVGPGLHRITARIENETPWAGGPREAALRRTFCSAHTTLRASDGGRFISQTDPPPALREAAEACENQGTWPVLVGEVGNHDTILSSPIILEDHPRIAPESPGDLFDGGEIDQLLILNILGLTDAEKAEARASDPRVREILDRSEGLSSLEVMALNGRSDVALRSELARTEGRNPSEAEQARVRT